MSQATPVDRTDRSDRAEKERPAPSRRLSPRAKKRRASDQDDTTAATAAAVAADKKQKGSVFSRISFPEAGSKKSKTEPSNGLKDKQKERETSVAGHRPATNGHRDDSKAGKGTMPSSEGRRGRGHDHESSEEEYHFKRRPTSRREAEDEGRGKKERGEHGHSHDRPKRR